jgi:Gpi18-like mannosyltransferase
MNIKKNIDNTVKVLKNRPYLILLLGSILFIFSIIILFTYSNILIYNFSPDRSGKLTGLGRGQAVIPAMVQYDSGHYIAIAEHGYKFDYNAAFLPLFPLSIRLATYFINNIQLAALAIDWIFLILAVLIFYKFIKFEIDKNKLNISPWLVLGLISIFPTSFYFAIPYTESLFLLLTASAFYFYNKNKYIYSSVFAFLASLTKYLGVVFALFILIDLIIKKKDKLIKIIPLVFSGLGFITYMIFLNNSYGNPLEFLKAEKYWGRDYGSIFLNFAHSFRPEYLWYFPVISIALYGVYKYLNKSYFWYSLVYLLIPLSNGRLDALNRYVITDLPIFIGLTLIFVSLSKGYRYFYLFGSGYLFSMSILLFANGYLVA